MKNIPGSYSPSVVEVEKYIDRWNHLENYVNQERALDKLFLKRFPTNIELEDILIKCSTLNDFYSTNIFDVHSVAKHIWMIENMDKRLLNGDITLVDEIAHVKVGLENKPRLFYSFATKYCSHHQPYKYAIYDNYVEKVLMFFKRRDGFSEFTLRELKDYATYMRVIHDFMRYYRLEQYNLKQIDQYLWQVGKEHYSKF